MYDQLSLRFIKADLFLPLIKSIVAHPVTENKAVARILELCACHKEGITILQKHLR